MTRGRSLLILALLMAAVASTAAVLARLSIGPLGFHATARPLAIAAIVALVVYAGFFAVSRAFQARRPEVARSLVHLQTVATAIVAIVAIMGLVGGFTSAIVGLGLVGFGLTLALQRPILAVAGWANLVLGGNVKVGDRVRVNNLEGDVLDITLFSTRLWEVGAEGSNTPRRPTGRIVTVTNAVFLEHPVSNATSDTPVVFDEFVVNVAFESDLELAKQLLIETGKQVLQYEHHAKLAKTYRRLTSGLAMEADFPDHPTILAESKPSWMEFRLRYLVDARRAGRTQSRLTHKWTELTAPHADTIPQVYNRTQPQAIGPDGRARP